MKLLISLLIRNAYVFLFLILESLSILLVIRYNGFQRNSFYSTYGDLRGRIEQASSNVLNYFSLRLQNERLHQENAVLWNHLANRSNKSRLMPQNRKDSIEINKFIYHPAMVIRNSISSRHNYLMINLGEVDGIKQDMAVVSDKGVVGIVKETSDHFATVISLLHSNAYLSAKHQPSQMEGSINWDGRHYQFGTMQYVPSHTPIERGDTVVTSGNSFIFPEDIPIGIIDEFEVDAGSKLYRIKVRFSNDFNSLHQVYIVENLLQEEQRMLLNQTESEDE